MKRSCEGCYWFGNCSGRELCGMYDPVDDTEHVVRKEQIMDKQDFTSDWLLYLNRDDDVDYCEEPVNSTDVELIKTVGGDQYQ